ncbi:hypothetical protein [Mangrovicella endophytica]|uniref:hypothetical protein n=1 Tax=Mangrovicella endophytica TaxID=2066697 RepID=UPI000C9E0734|nr:hypothetical protein [Mangrovicella endophytica]
MGRLIAGAGWLVAGAMAVAWWQPQVGPLRLPFSGPSGAEIASHFRAMRKVPQRPSAPAVSTQTTASIERPKPAIRLEAPVTRTPPAAPQRRQATRMPKKPGEPAEPRRQTAAAVPIPRLKPAASPRPVQPAGKAFAEASPVPPGAIPILNAAKAVATAPAAPPLKTIPAGFRFAPVPPAPLSAPGAASQAKR